MAKLAGALWLAVLAWCLLLPSSAEVLNITDAAFEQHKNKRWVLGFLATFCEPCGEVDQLLVDFESKFGEHVKVGRVAHNDDLTLRFKVEGYPTILYLRDGSYYTFDGNRTVDTLMKFCAGDYTHYNPNPVPAQIAYTDYVIQLNDDSFERNVMSRRGAYWTVLFIDGSDADTQIIDVHYKELATAMKGKVRVARMEKSVSTATAGRFGLSEYPSLWVFRGGKRYPFEHSFVYEDMLNFAEGDFLNSTTVIDVKPLPTTEDDSSDVVVLTDETFESATEAMSSRGKTWFIEFYAPWCGHCKAISPIWEQVAHELKARMFVGKLDCVANKNTSERFDIPGFPTLLLFRGGKYWKYDGELRTKEAFLEWALEGYAKKEGAPVPPPFGQPPPEPTLLDQLENAGAALTAMWEYNNWAVVGLFGVGYTAGAGFTLYIALLKALLKAATPQGPPARPRPKNRPPKPQPTPQPKAAETPKPAAKSDNKKPKRN